MEQFTFNPLAIKYIHMQTHFIKKASLTGFDRDNKTLKRQVPKKKGKGLTKICMKRGELDTYENEMLHDNKKESWGFLCTVLDGVKKKKKGNSAKYLKSKKKIARYFIAK